MPKSLGTTYVHGESGDRNVVSFRGLTKLHRTNDSAANFSALETNLPNQQGIANEARFRDSLSPRCSRRFSDSDDHKKLYGRTRARARGATHALNVQRLEFNLSIATLSRLSSNELSRCCRATTGI